MNTDKIDELVDMLRPYADDDAALNRIHADCADLLGICRWYLEKMDKIEPKTLTEDDIMGLITDIDVAFISHALFHFRSLRKEFRKIKAHVR